MMRKSLVVAWLCGAAVVGVSAGSASAGSPPNHNHFLTTANGKVVQIGPHVCDNPEILHDAFHNFHTNVHTGEPTRIGGLTITPVRC